MPREYGRNQRVADLLQREIARLLLKETSFREAGLITVSFVDVSPDLKNASVYFTCLEPTCSEEALTDLLNERARHFRRLLGQSLALRAVPQLVFRFDHNLHRANRLTELIDRVNQDNR
ncbi:MAG: 30S ribosome-binding factor RbfA [Gammaproteobacteria bacterium]|nr:30S ribosome-binding factor RbfA [Gammaproteobacteria bacterium]MCY4210577.1 30S ribosome-binding factor RbfA [Gammaproteobacteria bacterium]MCY4282823.1 30S ribosome-binding factor RbfA [Gammaproteobacteria bacterium]MCY4337354.1 30S ribosome-binding factor RbfA [Gammaproteobacteria bacterium]